MDKQALFEELGELIKIATTNGNQISKKEIVSYFEDLDLNEEIITTLCDYFLEAGVQVIGYEKKEEQEANLDSEDIGVIRFYEEELSEIDEMTEEEKKDLVKRCIEGEDVRDLLIEGMLHDVVAIAKQYTSQGVMLGDLIQEGNIALLEALLELSDATMNPEQFIEERIHQSMRMLIGEQRSSNSIGNNMAKKANRLDEAATYLAKKFEREATVEELAEYLTMEVEEVKDIMKISLDAISVTNPEVTPDVN